MIRSFFLCVVYRDKLYIIAFIFFRPLQILSTDSDKRKKPGRNACSTELVSYVI